jgi:hypothetical protein
MNRIQQYFGISLVPMYSLIPMFYQFTTVSVDSESEALTKSPHTVVVAHQQESYLLEILKVKRNDYSLEPD